MTHIDEGAIAIVGALYEELGICGAVLDVMSSWVSHFRVPPEALTVLGMNAAELAANPQARDWLVHDLNAQPALPFTDDSFDHATCCVSVDYLTRPVEVFREVAAGRPPGRAVRLYLLEPPVPDEGHPGLAHVGRPHASADRCRVLPRVGRLRRARHARLHALGRHG